MEQQLPDGDFLGDGTADDGKPADDGQPDEHRKPADDGKPADAWNERNDGRKQHGEQRIERIDDDDEQRRGRLEEEEGGDDDGERAPGERTIQPEQHEQDQVKEKTDDMA